MDLTLQIHWDYQWHDAGVIRFSKAERGLLGSPMFFYYPDYILKALERSGGLDQESTVDKTALGLNLPCNFFQDYLQGEVAPVLRDIIPQGASRCHWVNALGYNRDPQQKIDRELLALGCSSPIGNLRIKQAADLLAASNENASVTTFDRKDVFTASEAIFGSSRYRKIVSGALGAGGDAPKLLLAETRNGSYAFEGTLPDSEVVNHWLVKFPRGRQSKADLQVLEGEAAVYRLLNERGFKTISGTDLEEKDGRLALWMPRFDRKRGTKGVIRHGVESIYSLLARIGDGSRLCHLEVIDKILESVTQPADKDSILADYLVRDIVNTAIGNRDNHGRNMALLKRGSQVELAPAYDLAPMALDPEGVAPTTWWPPSLLSNRHNADYRSILNHWATQPEHAATLMMTSLKKLTNLENGLKQQGAPKAMTEHSAIRMSEPERVLRELEDWIG